MFELYVYKSNFSRFRIWCDDMPTAVPVYCHCLGLFQPTPAPPHNAFAGRGGLLFKFNPLCVMIVNTGCNEFSLSLVKM